ncbi:hypothetical protein QBC39DRAFT_356053, partial [Podospora conica]
MGLFLVSSLLFSPLLSGLVVRRYTTVDTFPLSFFFFSATASVLFSSHIPPPFMDGVSGSARSGRLRCLYIIPPSPARVQVA